MDRSGERRGGGVDSIPRVGASGGKATVPACDSTTTPQSSTSCRSTEKGTSGKRGLGKTSEIMWEALPTNEAPRGGRGGLRPSGISVVMGSVVVNKNISPSAPSPCKPTFLRRHLARQISEYLSSSLNTHNLSESLQVKSKMTAASELQKDTQADGDVDKGPDTNKDVATDKTTSNVLSTSEAANVSAFEQAPSSLDVSQRDEGEAPGHGDAVVNEDIEGEGAARTTLQVVVSLTDMLVPRHDCCGAPVKTAICRC